MDNRLVFAVLFVTLSWMSVGTYAQTTTNTTGTNSTTVMPGNTTTAMSGNMTTAMSGNMTTAMSGNTSTAMPGNTSTAMPGNTSTAMPGNTTTAMSGTMTTAMPGNMTTAMSGNMTTAMSHSNGTTPMPGNGTTAAVAPPPLKTNTTVETLTANISRTGCGTEQLCAAQPASCDPSSGASCFFLGAKLRGGRNFDFELAGESDGYLAATLSPDATVGNGDDTYVCANDNGVVKFFGSVFENGQLRNKTLNVNSVKGKVTGRRIQCTFSATVPESLTRTTNLALAISTGTFDSAAGTLGTPQEQLRSPVVNLANPNTNVTNTISDSTTAAPATTTGHAVTLQQSLTHVVLVLAGVLGLAML